jgi:hypothetical protein
MNIMANLTNPPPAPGDCVAIAKSAIKVVMPVKTGIQKLLNILDSAVSSTGQAHRRAPLAWNDKKVITTQSLRCGNSFQ